VIRPVPRCCSSSHPPPVVQALLDPLVTHHPHSVVGEGGWYLRLESKQH